MATKFKSKITGSDYEQKRQSAIVDVRNLKRRIIFPHYLIEDERFWSHLDSAYEELEKAQRRLYQLKNEEKLRKPKEEEGNAAESPSVISAS